MYKFFNNKLGQSVSEYAITIAMVTVVLTTMSIFLQRSLQAKVRDASFWTIETIRKEVPDVPLNFQYEPYYTESDSLVTTNSMRAMTLGQGGASGTAKKILREKTSINSVGAQLPPTND